jgi:hypothetical protein
MLAFLPVLPIAGSGHADTLRSFVRECCSIQTLCRTYSFFLQQEEAEVDCLCVVGG